MKTINPVVSNLPCSGIRQIYNEANQYSDVLHLEIGQPNFPTPSHIIQAAHQAARDGFTSYTPNAGLVSLREAFSFSLQRDYQIQVSPDQVVVSVGAMGALFNTFAVLTARNDEVLIPDPGYPNYSMALKLLHVSPVAYPLYIKHDNFCIDTGIIKSLITKRTKAIVINSPSNPTGLMLDTKTMAEIVEIATQAGIFFISDEAYDHIIFDKLHVSALSMEQSERIISIFSCSKTYAMTGWRVGFAVAPVEISQMIAKIQEATISCASSISQKAAETAILGPQDCVEQMKIAYLENRDDAIRMCEQFSIKYIKPDGAFYLMISLPPFIHQNSMKFSLDLLKEMKVAVAPGSTFGSQGEGYIRIALCTSKVNIKEGIQRIASYFSKVNHDQ